MTQPMVSIICTVYNKEPWIEQTLSRFLEQKTNFSYEILVIDDASTDNSWQLIQSFQSEHPDVVRIFANERNEGIARTWVTVCQKARGKYIARCDGDDFWLDPLKLQKQVDLLEATPDSAWSNTDFDIYDENGDFVSSAGFESGTIPLADSYEKMLATRGFTMASTWLVERTMMLEVNEQLDLTTADDTFDLQLELFQRTTLTYLPDATVAYVINQGSDSRPRSVKEQAVRFHRLLDTQKKFVTRYPERISEKLVQELLERANNLELSLSEAVVDPEGLGFEGVTIYFSDDQSGFTETRSSSFTLRKEAQIDIRIPEGCSRIRVDLSERPNFYDLVHLECKDGQPIAVSWSNGVAFEQGYLFFESDPQLIYDLPDQIPDGIVRLSYKMSQMKNREHPDYLVKKMVTALAEVQNHLEELEAENICMKNSRRWRIPTAIINVFRRRK
ncbi:MULTISPECIES: glycosyltransferase family 2 protein [unclassified Streptococcus]|uniref:glycosyltransferase family 2 protein n=1 Tax=unclassified Streptococcus TaxID=2608887 RepID=UPI001071F392|nr:MULTISPECIES: glycosyltransferase family 2 protein [unclassified Streptococcus]MBF0806393.1 glycosyltransferase family 2 protein [Streptococcus sp. 19428wA2_WM07]TFU27981.1 glycosyltransferase family 2 protein [Streptococcus sp. WM07]